MCLGFKWLTYFKSLKHSPGAFFVAKLVLTCSCLPEWVPTGHGSLCLLALALPALGGSSLAAFVTEHWVLGWLQRLLWIFTGGLY